MSDIEAARLIEVEPHRFRLTGAVDLSTVMTLVNQIDGMVPAGKEIFLDVADLHVKGSAVLGLLVYLLRRTAISGGSVTIENPSEKLRKTAKLADVQGILGL